MPGFNPDLPAVMGLQWFPTSEPSITLDSDTTCAAAQLTASVTEDIDVIRVALDDVSSDAELGGWELEVYELPLASSGGTLQTATFVPTADAVNATWGWTDSTRIDPPTAHYTLVDNTVDVPGTWLPPGDFAPITPGLKPLFDKDFIAGIFGFEANWSGYFGAANGFFTNERILCVRQIAVVQEFLTEFAVGQAGVSITPYMTIDGRDYNGPTQRIRGERPSGTTIVTDWWRKPGSECGWFPSDLDDFDGSTALGWKMAPTGSPHDFPAIFKVRMEVLYSATDIRTTVGCLDSPVPGWNEISLDDTWAKASGTEYVIALRRRSPRGWIKWRYLTGDDAPGWERLRPPVNANGRRLTADATGRDADFGTALDGAHSILLETDGGVTSVDGQPYFSVDGDQPVGSDPETRASATHDWTSVNSGQSLFQGLPASGSTAVRGFLRLLVRQDAGEVSGDLTIKIRRDSDNVQMGSTETITTDDLIPSRLRWQVVEIQMTTAPSLDTATAYYLEATSAADPDTGWQIQVLSTILVADAGGPPADVTLAMYAGRLAIGTSFDADQVDELTMAATVHTLPTTPANFDAVAVTDGCLGWNALGWSATSLAADFTQYEIDRLGIDGATWQRIAEITDEAVVSIEDHEARRNTCESYRIRVRRADRAASVWSTTQEACQTDECCGYRFTSNSEPDLSLWFDDIGARAYTAVEARTEQRFVGRDGAVTYYGLEDGLDRFSISLLVAIDGGAGNTPDPGAGGRREFDPLLVLAGNKRSLTTHEKVTVPYVCVLDEGGNRWLAAVNTGGQDAIKRTEPGGMYRMDVGVVEAVTDPYPIDATAGS